MEDGFATNTLTTNDPQVSLLMNNNTSTTQTTVTISPEIVRASSDWTLRPTAWYVKFNSQTHKLEAGQNITVTGLFPGGRYEISGGALYGDVMVYTRYNSTITTKSLVKGVTASSVGPTSVVLTSGCIEEDLSVAKCWFEVGGQTYEAVKGDVVTAQATGLAPNRKYTAVFKAQAVTGEVCSSSVEFTTSGLTLKTLAPKGVSSTCAIVAAETNIADAEPNVGFQWKKIDAPASLAPKEGYAAIYDGRLEGYIQNLQPTYYNVRAFYKNSGGGYIYSDWVTFDPTDFSFFEPTVHTYEVISVSHDSAMLKGYVLAGTDAIKSQGFQYWLTDAKQEDRISTVRASSAQVMTASIKGLKSSTSYTYRAFVETEAGYKYGEEQTFSTAAGSGLVWDEARIDSPAGDVEIVAIYDLMGQRRGELRPGLNIVLYSDGTSKKIYVKE